MNRWRTMLVAVALLVPGMAAAQKPSNNMHTRSADTYLNTANNQPVLADKEEYLRKALEAAMAGIAADPDNSRSWFQAGQAYLGLKDYVGADSTFDRAEQLWPEYAKEIDPMRLNAWIEAYNAGVTALQSNDYAEAQKQLELANVLYRKRPEAMVTLGSLYVQTGELEKGIETFQSALEVLRGPERASLSADQAKAWAEDEEGVSMRLANVLTELGKLAEAEQVYADLLKSQPGNTAARASLARVQSRAGKTAEAAATFRELLSAEDLSEATLFNIGVGLFGAEDYEQSAVAFRRALEQNPVSHDALYNLGQSLFARSAALEEQGAASNADALKSLNEELRQVTERLLALDPLNRNAMMMLAQSQRTLGELAGEGADGEQWRKATLATLEKHSALPFDVSEITTVAGEGTVQILGRVTNLKGTAGETVTLRFSAIDRNGTEIGGENVTVTLPATGEGVRFNTTVPAPEGAAGWKYVVQ